MEEYRQYPLKIYVGTMALPLAVRRVSAGRHGSRNFHRHDFTEIAVILEGHPLSIFVGLGGSRQLHPGDVLIVPPGTVHGYDEAGSLAILKVICRPEELLAAPRLEDLPACFTTAPNAGASFHFRPAERSALDAAASRMEAELYGKDASSHLRAVARFTDLLELILRNGTRGDSYSRLRERVEPLIALLRRDYTRDIGIEELCATASMSRRTLFRAFRDYTGFTPVEYLLRIRLQHAAEWVLSTDRKITDIATECGFCDGNYFCKLFHRAYGVAPSSFRK